MTDADNKTNNVVELPVPGLWYVLDDRMKPRPVPNQPGLAFPSMEDMERAFSYRWGYQSAVGSVVVSSTFLALNHGSWLRERTELQLFEVALMGLEGVDIIGRYGDIEDCLKAHYEAVETLEQRQRAANE